MIDPLTIMMLAVLALMVVFMIRNSRKQKADREALVSKVVKGANVMTTSGIFGTIVSLDEAENEIVLETTPGTKLRLHRQSVVSVIEKPVVEKSVSPAATQSAAPKSSVAKSAAAKPAAK
ncbi:MAG: preprotein translocase subunit YajC [Microbacteriaceae bacterium]|nr:preprotein translocase subunit YajC [Microbacteriaceae bacterium]